MSLKTALLVGGSLVALVGAGAAARRFLPCGSCCADTAACESPGADGGTGAVATTIGAPNGRYDRIQALGCEMSCAKKDVPEGTIVAEQPGVQPGQITRCPVSGVLIAASPEGTVVTIEGRAYHACCATCAERLAREPSRFLHL